MNTMKSFLASLCLLGTVGSLSAQNYYLATQQARRDSAQNDAEQQRIQREAAGPNGAPAPGSRYAAMPAATATPADPKLQATLKNVAGLQTDFAAIVASSDKPTPDQKTALLNDLSEAAQGTKASSGSVKKVAEDLWPAMAGQKKLVAAQQKKLAQQIHALFNSAHLTAPQQQAILNDIQKSLTDAGTSLDDTVNLVTDLKAVVAETK
jgi:hypothetical protein